MAALYSGIADQPPVPLSEKNEQVDHFVEKGQDSIWDILCVREYEVYFS